MHICMLRTLQNILQYFHVIDNRFCVWHRTDCRHTTRGCCTRTGNDVFLVCQSRITKMYMQINKPRHYIFTLCIDHKMSIFLGFVVICLLAAASHVNLLYTILFNQYVCDLVQPGCRIDDVTINYEHNNPPVYLYYIHLIRHTFLV